MDARAVCLINVAAQSLILVANNDGPLQLFEVDGCHHFFCQKTNLPHDEILFNPPCNRTTFRL